MKRRTLHEISKKPTPITTLTVWMVMQISITAGVANCAEPPSDAISSESHPSEIFESRIMPIFQSTRPSSCIQCHLASVDLKDYILPSHQETFIALERAGLIDRKHPSQSKILNLIRMGEKDPNLSAKRLHQKTRQAELEAFEDWIITTCEHDPPVLDSDASVNDEAKSKVATLVGPEHPNEVVRYTRKQRLIESFTREVWSQRMRCFPCHTPFEINASDPKHVKAKQRHEDLVKQYGARINLFEKDPSGTLDRWVAASRKKNQNHLPLINLDTPRESLILLKPLSKVPAKREDGTLSPVSSILPVSHAGGLKMFEHDQSYKAIRRWIEDYADVVQGKYVSVDQLPTEKWIPTQKIIRMSNVPDTNEVGTPVQIFVHPKSQKQGLPIAFTQGIVTPRGFVNGPLYEIVRKELNNADADSYAPDDNPATQPEGNMKSILTAGEYRIRVYVDRHGKLDIDPATYLTEEDFLGETSVTTQWKLGFPNATIFSASNLRR